MTETGVAIKGNDGSFVTDYEMKRYLPFFLSDSGFREWRLAGPTRWREFQPIRAFPPEVVIKEFRWKQTFGGAISWVLSTAYMMTVFWSKKFHETLFPTYVLKRLGLPESQFKTIVLSVQAYDWEGGISRTNLT